MNKNLQEKDSPEIASNFIHDIIDGDLDAGKNDGKVVTRFPPEPNGYLHIGHAKSICLNFGTALKYNGRCHMRFDDTNPTAEEEEYVHAILEDVTWLGFDWDNRLYYASDYFEHMYAHATKLIKKGNAYVCDLDPEAFKEYRGVPTRPGKESPSRNRSIEENMDLFERMKNGEFEEGAYVLRAKIDMASPNLHMRDPAIYRIKKEAHHRSGDTWSVYPMYDFAHCLEDAIEEVTHSLCTLEFEVHRPLYDWILNELGTFHSQQIEFARLNLSYTVMSKRRLLQLVQEKHVTGWDDPRMPTISGLRRRGYTPQSIRTFCEKIGVTKFNSLTEAALLEHCLRDDLNKHAERCMAVLRPLKVIITNYPEGQSEEFDGINNPEDESAGTRKVPFSRELYIERDDFMEEPPKKFFRLAPGRRSPLRYAYFVTCQDVIKNKTGDVTEIHCTYDPDSRGGHSPDGRKVKGTIHWVSAQHAVEAEIRLYDRLFTAENPMDVEEGKTWQDYLNPHSLDTITGFIEPALAKTNAGDRYQFERLGYFCVDPDSTDKKPVFNRTVSLRDSWAKLQKK